MEDIRQTLNMCKQSSKHFPNNHQLEEKCLSCFFFIDSNTVEGYFPSGLFPTPFAKIFSSKREDTISEILSCYEKLVIRHRDDVRKRYLEKCQDDLLYG